MSTHELVGVEISERDPKQVHTRVMGLTQQGKVPSFWCPKKLVRHMPPKVRPWSIWDRKPELAIIVVDETLTDKGQIMLRYHDGQSVILRLDDFARCGTVVVDKGTVTQIYTTRSAGQRDLFGHHHE